jgi:hypothetical protein
VPKTLSKKKKLNAFGNVLTEHDRQRAVDEANVGNDLFGKYFLSALETLGKVKSL